ncbi:NHLP bacteriocin system secretion protein [Nostoc sp. PA-18-2419]|uniref:NHLP bacteriocin system secretion protein n=1 Tax=Nostoc sp. PA-18-2419 TaxID=2575443 RepID=UPI001107A784|nr:NHLP bacteriocin system secretion protein [Nostoc sp. PA-18-2419]
MSNTNNRLFRQKSLERLSSPEKLDQLMRVVSPKSWWWLSTLGILVGGVLSWSIFGRIPISVTGQGVLVYIRGVTALQSNASGTLISIKVQSGDFVKKGQVIALIDQSDLQKQLQQQGHQLTALQAQFQTENKIQNQQMQLEQTQLKIQRQSYQAQLQQNRTVANIITQKNLQAIQDQQQSYQEQLQMVQALDKTFKQTLEVRRKLSKQGVISQDTLLQAEQQYIQNIDQIASLKTQFKQLEVQKAQIEQQNLENDNKFIDLKAQLVGLDNQEAALTLKSKQYFYSQQQQIEKLKQNIAQMKQQLDEQSQIISQHTGTILSIDKVVGDLVNLGNSIGTINRTITDGSYISHDLQALTYFTINDGKQIKPGMKVQISPTTVKREEFGGIIAKVSKVSPFPVTLPQVTVAVGNANLAQTLIAGERVIEVRTELQANPTNFSGYEWSSGKGPQSKVSAGITTTTLVVLENRAPITFVIPLLRDITGLE